MQTKLQIVAIVASSALVLIVFELLRRRRLVERYALLWLLSSLVLLLHFSLAISRLSGETKVLAQEVARLDKEMRDLAAAGKSDEVTAAAEVEAAEPPYVS